MKQNSADFCRSVPMTMLCTISEIGFATILIVLVNCIVFEERHSILFNTHCVKYRVLT